MSEIVEVRPLPERSPASPSVVFGHVIAIMITEAVLAIASVIWLRLSSAGLPWWVYAFVGVVIIGGYRAVLALKHSFVHEWQIPPNPWFHAALLAVLTVIVAAPMAMMLSFQNERLLVLEAADTKRADFYYAVGQSLPSMLAKPTLSATDVQLLFTECLQSIYLTNPRAAKDQDLRAAAFYVNSQKQLFVPTGAYSGWALPSTIQTLKLDISEKGHDESDDHYCERLGVAGWTFVHNRGIRSPNVLQPQANEHFCYKRFNADQNAPQDRAMVCVTIPKLGQPSEPIGVMCISSVREGVFTNSDAGLVSIVAAGLGKFSPPELAPAAGADMPRR